MNCFQKNKQTPKNVTVTMATASVGAPPTDATLHTNIITATNIMIFELYLKHEHTNTAPQVSKNVSTSQTHRQVSQKNIPVSQNERFYMAEASGSNKGGDKVMQS